ncbi:mitochondrial transcription termination factor family protein [Actinidia rufa]|uniref:Mitochondrial transcription termination factor family protein n=1 Tax=Actinidia rufa TaxID=165716 RepID=A0A7J0FGX4_9ERIC|nr:mitochondrial transcription termination factor family protein [Actinidia rufa]
MQDTLHLSSLHPTTTNALSKPNFPTNFSSLSGPRNLRFPSLSSPKISIYLPPKPPKTPEIHSPQTTTTHHSDFQEKLLYLDSLGIDFFSLLAAHPPVVAASVADVRAVIDFLRSTAGLSAAGIRRIAAMCPEVLAAKIFDLAPVLTFLLREAGVAAADLRRVLHRRPASSPAAALRHASAPPSTSSRASESPKSTDTRRFSLVLIKENFEPKFDYFMVEMGRELKELKEFPQYFSFSLENRIKPRHRECVEKGVFLSLPMMLKTSEARFLDRLEVCCDLSIPVRNSPLWCINYDENVL